MFYWNWARPPATMVAETASIVVGGGPWYTNRLIIVNLNNMLWCYFIDYYISFSYGYGQWQNQQWETKHLIRRPFRWSCGCIRAMPRGIAQCSMSRATPKATGGYHRVTIHSLLPWRPPGRQSTNLQWKIQPLCWPFWWPSRCAGTIPRALPNGGGPGLS